MLELRREEEERKELGRTVGREVQMCWDIRL